MRVVSLYRPPFASHARPVKCMETMGPFLVAAINTIQTTRRTNSIDSMVCPHCSLLFLCSVSPQTCPSSTQPPDQRASSARSPSPRKACQPMYARPVADALLHRACRLHSRSTFGSSRAPMKPCTLLNPLLPYHFLRASISERRSERVTPIVPCIRIPVPPSPPSIPLLFFAGVSMQNPN